MRPAHRDGDVVAHEQVGIDRRPDELAAGVAGERMRPPAVEEVHVREVEGRAVVGSEDGMGLPCPKKATPSIAGRDVIVAAVGRASAASRFDRIASFRSIDAAGDGARRAVWCAIQWLFHRASSSSAQAAKMSQCRHHPAFFFAPTLTILTAAPWMSSRKSHCDVVVLAEQSGASPRP